MKISELLTAIKDELNAAATLSMVRDIDMSPGRFNADEIARRSFKAPALRVAFLGAPKTQPRADDTRRFEGAFAVFILTDGRGRATDGVDIAQAVVELIEVNRFTDGRGVGIPANLRLDALYSGDVDDKGISLHSVSWTQSMTVGTSSGAGVATDPSAVIPDSAELDQDIDITLHPGEL